MMLQGTIGRGAVMAAMLCVAANAGAQTAGRGAAQPRAAGGCAALPNHAALKSALDKATADEKSGLNNHMWATVVDRDGAVCAVMVDESGPHVVVQPALLVGGRLVERALERGVVGQRGAAVGGTPL